MYNSYPGSYPQSYYTPAVVPSVPPAQMPAQQSNNSGIIWVQGETGAKSYFVAPNSTVVLWDAENQTIYIKSADASGMPTTRILDWTERVNNQKPVLPQNNDFLQTADYVTRDEFNALTERLNSLTTQINSAPTGAKNTNKKEEKANG